VRPPQLSPDEEGRTKRLGAALSFSRPLARSSNRQLYVGLQAGLVPPEGSEGMDDR
jgi:hypothetical protein